MQEYGLGGTGCTLAARVLGIPYTNHVITNKVGRPGWFELWILPDTDDGAYSGYEFYQVGLPHFPGGILVEPDEPL